MNNPKINKIIAQLVNHESRICKLEGVTNKNTKIDLGVKQPGKTQKVLSKGKAENLFPPIQKLLDGGFFKDWQSDVDVCNVLTIRLLTKKKPLRASVVNVLRAMIKNGSLTREKVLKNKRQVFAYKQIQ
ncbi:MAG: hypothetical protein V1649_04205 [Patescibacteria group bacterium]